MNSTPELQPSLIGTVRPLSDEGTVHWIETGPGRTGDLVTDEELEAASDWLEAYKEKLSAR